jgi:cytochrome b
MTEEATRRVWDLPVRITHWLLVLGIVGSYATHKAGVAYFQYHAWFGYSVLVLASFRILWGFVGTRHARFSNFLRGPRATAGYLLQVFRRDAGGPHPGHNPLGAWMVVLFLFLLVAQGATGLFTNDEIFNLGPLYGYVSDALSLTLTSWHRRLFDWILIAIAAHVLAIVGHRTLAGHRLVGPMITGRKPAAHVPASEAIESSRLWLAAILLASLVSGLAWTVSQAPEPQVFGFD